MSGCGAFGGGHFPALKDWPPSQTAHGRLLLLCLLVITPLVFLLVLAIFDEFMVSLTPDPKLLGKGRGEVN